MRSAVIHPRNWGGQGDKGRYIMVAELHENRLPIRKHRGKRRRTPGSGLMFTGGATPVKTFVSAIRCRGALFYNLHYGSAGAVFVFGINRVFCSRNFLKLCALLRVLDPIRADALQGL
jgi:hypothetical protein